MTQPTVTTNDAASPGLGRDWRLLVDGGLATAAEGARYDVEAPHLGRRIATVPDASAADVDCAVDAAHRAFPSWAGLGAEERAQIVRRLADALEADVEELARLDSWDTGIPLWMMRKDIGTAAARMRMFADWALQLRGETIPSSGNLHFTERVPYGVVARILAFNHPGMFAASKVAAPLVAGNSVVLKPSNLTPLSALRLGELWREIVPPGVLSVVAGSGVETGDALVRHPHVRRIAFTGSPATGRAIQRAAAEGAVKDVSLELGGKNALIAFPDAAADAVVDAAIKGMNFAFAGQSCGSTSRLLVHRELVDDVVARLADRFASIVVGDPFAMDSRMGPLISAAQRDGVRTHVDHAREDGARIVCTGSVPDDAGGYWYPPTLLDRVTPQMRIAQEEVFGPVLSVMSFDSEEEAVQTANGVSFGLTASVFTCDLDRAHRVARAMEAGYVWVNDTSTHFPGMPFGGVKESGVGREESVDELLGYTQIKTYNVVTS